MKTTTILKIATLSVMAAARCSAAAISINNPGFENPAVLSGSFTLGVATGWTIVGAGGVFRPTAGELPTPTEGVQVGYANVSSSVSQVLSANLTANVVYTLQADFFSRIDCCAWPGGQLELFAGSTLLASDTIMTLAPGGTHASTVTFTALPGDPNLLQPLKIQFVNIASTGQGQINFDNVRLDASGSTSGVPEPGTAALASGALLLFVLGARGRKWTRIKF